MVDTQPPFQDPAAAPAGAAAASPSPGSPLQGHPTPDGPNPASLGPGSPPAAAPAPAHTAAGALWLFTPTTFLSALLLFSVQPMFAKMVLPVLGGAPSVWAVAMFFFQGALLAGYCYAHVLMARVAMARTGFVHLALTLAAVAVLPIGLPDGWGEPPAGEPYLWQLAMFTVAIGLPFIAVSANAPLLQAWFAATGHRQGKDPYFLYAASNLGSLLALLAYPFLLEPALGVSALAKIWTVGYVLLLACLAACFWMVVRAQRAGLPAVPVDEVTRDGPAPADASPDAAPHAPAGQPTWPARLGWVGLALVPSALLTAVTTHITTDVASAPLLWVLPLALYLLTFVIVFRERALIPQRVLLVLHLAAVVVALFLIAQTKHEGWVLSSTAGIVVFLTSALVAHRTLYDARPAARHLTEFYLWMSLGGALGGLFAALVAPQIFSEVFEYPLLLALTMACRPGAADVFRLTGRAIVTGLARLGLPVGNSGAAFTRQEGDALMRLWLILAAGLLAVFWLPFIIEHFDIHIEDYGSTAIVAGLLAIALIALYWWPAGQLVLALVMFATVALLPSGVRKGEAQRSFFGVYRVMQSDDGHYNILMHGTTLHGAQRIRDDNGNLVADITPGTYYYPKSPMAQSVALQRAALATTGRAGRFGVIGLGTGSLACLSAPGETWRFFEIDPVVIEIAAKSGNFTFIENCQPRLDVVIGDARLTMARETDATYDLIIVDAFTSDAVPVHLMTKEALEIYAAKIRDDGIFVLHISNRYLDLERVLAGTVKTVPGLQGVVLSDDEADGSYASTTSTVVIISKSDAALAPFRDLEGAHDLDTDTTQRAWTDDYSDILGPLLTKLGTRSDSLRRLCDYLC